MDLLCSDKGIVIMKHSTAHCYCGLWESNPTFLSDQGLSEGFCGFCECCGELGHTRHAPVPSPRTGSWCDGCFNLLSKLHWFYKLLLIVFLIAVAISTWWLCLLACALFVLSMKFQNSMVRRLKLVLG